MNRPKEWEKSCKTTRMIPGSITEELLCFSGISIDKADVEFSGRKTYLYVDNTSSVVGGASFVIQLSTNPESRGAWSTRKGGTNIEVTQAPLYRVYGFTVVYEDDTKWSSPLLYGKHEDTDRYNEEWSKEIIVKSVSNQTKMRYTYDCSMYTRGRNVEEYTCFEDDGVQITDTDPDFEIYKSQGMLWISSNIQMDKLYFCDGDMYPPGIRSCHSEASFEMPINPNERDRPAEFDGNLPRGPMHVVAILDGHSYPVVCDWPATSGTRSPCWVGWGTP